MEALERYENALTAFEQAIHLDPNLADAYIGRDRALQQLGISREVQERLESQLQEAQQQLADQQKRTEALGQLGIAKKAQEELTSQLEKVQQQLSTQQKRLEQLENELREAHKRNIAQQVEKLGLLHTLSGHTDVVWSVAISPDGQTLVSGSSDSTIKVWNLSTGKQVRTLTDHTDMVMNVAIHPDGQTLVSGSDDQTIKAWNLSTSKEVCTLSGHANVVGSVAISLDGQILVSGSRDNTIKVWGTQ